ncbi:MAG TPA: hypothetical protein VK969_00085 [Acidimicrobiia bacterium]|nr:hypothetical protein [Acidimicrobiia bacterium]
MEATLGRYRIEVATEFGPRITSLRRDDGPEMLARLGPEAVITHEGGTYRFRGGHRLWAAPEVAAVTYASDDHECDVSETSDSIVVTAPPDTAGLVKEVSISADAESLVVDHRLTGSGLRGAVAPWALTQLPLGGTAILPVIGDDTAPEANRYLVLWPYTSVEDKRVTLCDDVVEIEATEGPPIKFASGPTPRRLGYFIDGLLFLKEIESAENREVPDFGAVAQVYVGSGFCELESVGGLTDLSEGAAGTLRERWTVIDCGDLDAGVKLTVGT